MIAWRLGLWSLAGILLVPYLVLMAFAAALNLALWRLRAPSIVGRSRSAAIWRAHLPDDHAVDAPLLTDVARRCALSGGQIRNAALHATLLSLAGGGPVGAEHLSSAVRREYRKLGQTCPLP